MQTKSLKMKSETTTVNQTMHSQLKHPEDSRLTLQMPRSSSTSPAVHSIQTVIDVKSQQRKRLRLIACKKLTNPLKRIMTKLTKPSVVKVKSSQTTKHQTNRIQPKNWVPFFLQKNWNPNPDKTILKLNN